MNVLGFHELREQYRRFLYQDYEVERKDDRYRVTYHFSIPGLCDFAPVWEFPFSKEADMEVLRMLLFHLGMAETISYWKCACPKEIDVQCGELTDAQVKWWKKLFYYGLGEFMYRNRIDVEKEELVQIQCEKSTKPPLKDSGIYKGCLVPVGGGKDSVVSLELLKGKELVTYSINGNATTENIINICDHKAGNYSVKRVLDPKLLEVNAKGFLNGHTPFSAIVAFSSVIAAYLNGIRDVVLSNESSANETTVRNSYVNHQYSKSYEFEQDFSWYVKSLADFDIHYFSLLRPLTEMQIAWLFSSCRKYHGAFRSCNAGSKKGVWCCNCPKCLFVYIILTPFLSEDELTAIFGENLLNKESLEKDFRELTGIDDNKPFECVGTRKEVLAALKEFVTGGGKSVLTDRYRDVILAEEDCVQNILRSWADQNSVPEEYQAIIKRHMGQ